jgi:hypothetical protein
LQIFTFGSSPENDIVLKVDEAEEEGCYVNLKHCCIYPDPDSDAVLLNNLSSSTFSIQHLKSGAKISIAPSYDSFIKDGTWRLTLGGGALLSTQSFATTLAGRGWLHLGSTLKL